MKYKCPNCNQKIDIKKYKLITCVCGSNLLAVEINKELLVEDVTLEYGKFIKEELKK